MNVIQVDFNLMAQARLLKFFPRVYDEISKNIVQFILFSDERFQMIQAQYQMTCIRTGIIE